MAYDPNDAADKKIVDKLIADAVAAAEAEHETATQGLKDKNKQLLDKLKKAENGEANPAEVARLEGEIETLQATIKTSAKELKLAQKAAEEATKGFETESSYSRQLLVDNGLTDALVGAKVASQFLPAVKAFLAPQVTVKTDGDTRLAMVGDKSLGDFVKEWSLGDNGKHYVAAPGNGGGGAPGGKADGSGKTMTRAAYNDLSASSPGDASAFFREGGSLTD